MQLINGQTRTVGESSDRQKPSVYRRDRARETATQRRSDLHIQGTRGDQGDTVDYYAGRVQPRRVAAPKKELWVPQPPV